MKKDLFLISKICANVQVQAHFPDTPVEGVAATMTTVLPIFPPLPVLDQLMDTDPDREPGYTASPRPSPTGRSCWTPSSSWSSPGWSTRTPATGCWTSLTAATAPTFYSFSVMPSANSEACTPTTQTPKKSTRFTVPVPNKWLKTCLKRSSNITPEARNSPRFILNLWQWQLTDLQFTTHFGLVKKPICPQSATWRWSSDEAIWRNF